MYRLQICRDNPFLKKIQGTPLSDINMLANHQKSCYWNKKPLVQKCIFTVILVEIALLINSNLGDIHDRIFNGFYNTTSKLTFLSDTGCFFCFVDFSFWKTHAQKSSWGSY